MEVSEVQHLLPSTGERQAHLVFLPCITNDFFTQHLCEDVLFLISANLDCSLSQSETVP